jgi:hypothetical protein
VAGVENRQPVEWLKQERLYFCGPAVAQMFLNFFGVGVSQPDLWTDIQYNSGGTRPPDAPATDHDFPQQVCENCNGTTPPQWECWDTTPEALQKTVAARWGNAPLAGHYPGTFDEGVGLLIESLDRTPAIPSFATIQLVNHWVLVNGYLRDDFTSVEFPPQKVGKYNLNGVYILDPLQEDDVQRVRLVAVNDWRAQFGSIACAMSKNVDKYPVIVGENSKFPRWLAAVLTITIISIAILLWLWMLATR